jgi:hypothetical protein
MESFPGEAGWKHDEKRITVVVEGPTMARDGYRVVKREGGGATNLYRKRGTKEDAVEDAIEWMRNHPDGSSTSKPTGYKRSRANRGR